MLEIEISNTCFFKYGNEKFWVTLLIFVRHVGAVIWRIVISWPTWYRSEYILQIFAVVWRQLLNLIKFCLTMFRFCPFNTEIVIFCLFVGKFILCPMIWSINASILCTFKFSWSPWASCIWDTHSDGKIAKSNLYLYRWKHSNNRKLKNFLKSNKSTLFWRWYNCGFKKYYQATIDKISLSPVI